MIRSILLIAVGVVIASSTTDLADLCADNDDSSCQEYCKSKFGDKLTSATCKVDDANNVRECICKYETVETDEWTIQNTGGTGGATGGTTGTAAGGATGGTTGTATGGATGGTTGTATGGATGGTTGGTTGGITGTWKQIPGVAKQISAKGDQLCAVTDDMNMMCWNGAAWKHGTMNGRSSRIAASADGSVFIAQKEYFGAEGTACRMKTSNGAWQRLGSYGTSVNSYSFDSAVVVDDRGTIYHYKNGGWIDLKATDPWKVAIGENDETWMLDLTGNVLRYVSGAWTQTTNGRGKYIDVQSASRVVLTDFNDNIYLYSNNDWTQVAGKECIQATIGSSAIYCLDNKHRVWKLNA